MVILIDKDTRVINNEFGMFVVQTRVDGYDKNGKPRDIWSFQCNYRDFENIIKYLMKMHPDILEEKVIELKDFANEYRKILKEIEEKFKNVKAEMVLPREFKPKIVRNRKDKKID